MLSKYFKKEEDAAKVIDDLQHVIDKKFEEKKTELATSKIYQN